jgi:tripartite-type tricarboxylate transporter receptor subunit TctC
MKEAGFPDFELTSWFAALAPADTPQPIIARLNGWFHQILARQETKDFFKLSGADTMPGTPAALRQRQIAETEKWARIVRLANIEPQ